MFSSSSQVAPVSGRVWGIAIGSVVVVATPAMLVSAKTVQATLPLLLVVTLAAALNRGQWRVAIPPMSGVTICLSAFLLYALASAVWTGEPMPPLLVVVGALVSWGAITLVQALRSESHGNALHIAEGLWMGLLVGLIYAFAEVVSDQAIKIWVYNALELGPEHLEPDRFFTWQDGRLLAVHSDDLKRNLTPVPLLLWPALIAAGTITSRTWQNVIVASLLVIAIAAVFLSPSYTCRIALFAGLVTFVCCRYLPRFSYVGLTIAWLTACLAVIPIVMAGRAMEMQDAAWLPLSAQLRVVIWNEIAHLVTNAPVFGVGTDMTYFLQPQLHDVPANGQPWLGFLIPHPHNVYLQIWYELGLVGALLFAGLGTALLKQIATVAHSARPYLFAVFAAAAVEMSMSYNLWQIWFMCMFGFAAAMCALAVNLSQPGPLRSHEAAA